MEYAAKFLQGLKYSDFLTTHGTAEQRQRWENFHRTLKLNDSQRQLLAGFARDMKVMVLAGAWCGDCVNQCPIFDHFAAETSRLDVRYFDRDAHPDFAAGLSVCGGARVPVVLFLSEDFQQVGWYGDRTLSKYRNMAATLDGAACPTGIVPDQASLVAAVVQEWLNEFERCQWILRTSARLRKIHGD
jgi:thiol-disulfide isomerase/thioredoxin